MKIMMHPTSSSPPIAHAYQPSSSSGAFNARVEHISPQLAYRELEQPPHTHASPAAPASYQHQHHQHAPYHYSNAQAQFNYHSIKYASPPSNYHSIDNNKAQHSMQPGSIYTPVGYSYSSVTSSSMTTPYQPSLPGDYHTYSSHFPSNMEHYTHTPSQSHTQTPVTITSYSNPTHSSAMLDSAAYSFITSTSASAPYNMTYFSRVTCACSHCKKAKTRCDNMRPCGRCRRLGREATCVDSIHLRKSKNNAAAQDKADADKKSNKPKEKGSHKAGDETGHDALKEPLKATAAQSDQPIIAPKPEDVHDTASLHVYASGSNTHPSQSHSLGTSSHNTTPSINSVSNRSPTSPPLAAGADPISTPSSLASRKRAATHLHDHVSNTDMVRIISPPPQAEQASRATTSMGTSTSHDIELASLTHPMLAYPTVAHSFDNGHMAKRQAVAYNMLNPLPSQTNPTYVTSSVPVSYRHALTHGNLTTFSSSSLLHNSQPSLYTLPSTSGMLESPGSSPGVSSRSLVSSHGASLPVVNTIAMPRAQTMSAFTPLQVPVPRPARGVNHQMQGSSTQANYANSNAASGNSYQISQQLFHHKPQPS